MIDKNKNLPINEIYTCLQGEGKYAGIPHILIRTVGCKLRCQFSNSFCDTSFNSWKPEKGNKTWGDIQEMYDKNPQIKHTMITGGGPTMHPELLIEMVDYAKSHRHTVTIETEGSEFVKTNADLISLSPKLTSSAPRLKSINSYTGQEVKQTMIDQHEKWRKNYQAMLMLITHHSDFILKPVINSYNNGDSDMEEVKYIQRYLDVPNDKVYLMPEGVTEEQLQKNRHYLFNLCIQEGYRYSDRLHVIAYGDKRGV